MALKKLEFGSLPHLGAQSAGGQRQPVLLALRAGDDASIASLRCTAAIAQGLGAHVHVVRVAAVGYPWSTVDASMRHSSCNGPLDMYAAHRTTRAQLVALLGRDVPWTHHQVRTGGFLDEVARHAAVLRARLVILSQEPRLGSMAVSLALRTSASVLVARSSTEARITVAYPDLDSPANILANAQSAEADLLVVRMPAPTSAQRIARAVAPRVVEEATCSVLIEPPTRSNHRGLA
jgi:hypothetical protein